ncbi:MAG: FAD-dependent oxidoreductase, partial [Eggerthellaceae bacterium]|nr:FAD-dependent oxidoreductase [Eggerthellaceae bacterium]
NYDKLVLSPGAKPVVPNIPGVDLEHIFTLRNVEDTFAIYDFMAENTPRSVAIIGGGFIGIEMAENIAGRKIAVTLYQRPKQVLPMLDEDMACFVHNHINANGIDLRLGANVQELMERDGQIIVRDAEGEDAFDMVVLAIGVAPESTLARDSGLELGVKGSIVVDEHLRTSDPDIFAVGDAVQVKNLVTGLESTIPLAGPANKQGRIVADNICGIDSVFRGSLGSSVIKVFKLTAAATGLNERAARAAGIPCDAVLLGPATHATYYPGASHMQLKVVFNPENGRVLGGQAIATDNAEKSIDVIATSIQAGLTMRDLEQLDLCYAPPYSSAKDPVNFAGFVAENIMDGRVEQVRWSDALNAPEDVVVLDMRNTGEVKRGKVPGALWIPLDELRERMDELPQGKRFYAFCHTGLRSYIGCCMLNQHGYSCANIAGGFMFYEANRISQLM